MNKTLPLLSIALLSNPFAKAAMPALKTSPNVLIIIGDDCSYSDFSVYGGPNTKNPNLHALASKQGNSFPFAKWTCYNQGLHSGMIISYPKVVKPNSVSNALVEYVDIIPTLLDMARIKVEPGRLDGKSFYHVLQQKTDEHKKNTFGIQTTRGIISGSDYYGIRSAATKQHRYIRNLTPDAIFKNVATGP
jgi:arylsulfatase A-like enzyme